MNTSIEVTCTVELLVIKSKVKEIPYNYSVKIALTAEKLCVVGGLLAQRDIFPADLSILATQLTCPAIYFYKVKCNPDKKNSNSLI